MIETIQGLATTGIGSLPHKTVEEALRESFRVDIPYLPELPMRDAREYMLPHATEGIPGIVHDDQGMIAIDLDRWKRGRGAFDDKLHAAIDENRLDLFLPPESHRIALWPFLELLRRRQAKLAKVQVAGPLTIQWLLRTTSGEIPPAGVFTHVTRTILARSLALANAVQAPGVQPIVFLDEPGLYALSRAQPRHLLMLQELRINIMALRKRGASVGLHCCSDADWGTLLGLGFDVIAIDAGLSLGSLLRAGDALMTFVSLGGRLLLGAIPTNAGERHTVDELVENINQHMETLESYFPTRASVLQHVLGRSLLSTACGLALKTPEEAESMIDQLNAFRKAYAPSFRG